MNPPKLDMHISEMSKYLVGYRFQYDNIVTEVTRVEAPNLMFVKNKVRLRT